MPAIQLCSRTALDEFLTAYWPDLLRKIDGYDALASDFDAVVTERNRIASDRDAKTARMWELGKECDALASALRRVEPYLDLVPPSAAAQVREALAAYDAHVAKQAIVQVP